MRKMLFAVLSIVALSLNQGVVAASLSEFNVINDSDDLLIYTKPMTADIAEWGLDWTLGFIHPREVRKLNTEEQASLKDGFFKQKVLYAGGYDYVPIKLSEYTKPISGEARWVHKELRELDLSDPVKLRFFIIKNTGTVDEGKVRQLEGGNFDFWSDIYPKKTMVVSEYTLPKNVDRVVYRDGKLTYNTDKGSISIESDRKLSLDKWLEEDD